ncbi:MAG: Holliday junction branch migration protein RuvA, partial [bacterium]
IFIPLSSYDRLPVVNSACRLLTYDYVREDQRTLYGFQTDAERNMFILLMGVSGIGPKIAIGALSGISLGDLATAISTGDVQRLGSVPGIGRKKAERMVVELRDKVGEGAAITAAGGAGGVPGDNVVVRDAMLALVSLGYKQNEARAMVVSVMERGDANNVEETVRKALAKAQRGE